MDANSSQTTPTGNNNGSKSKFKSKFASGSSASKFLSKTPTTASDDSNNNNNNNINNNNEDQPSLSKFDKFDSSGGASVTSPMSFRSKQEQYQVANTDFHESDGRDVRVLGTTHQLPLQYRWTLWHTAPKSKDQGWSHNYKEIAAFDTVGTFWQLFNNIAPPTMLQPGSSYHLFKGKVKPMWEDKFNLGGGSWTYRFGDFAKQKGRGRGGRGRHSNNNSNNEEEASNIINYAWYYTVLNMIGNNFDNYNENICGVVISVRKHGRGKIELWIKQASNRRSTDSIGYDFKFFSGAKKRNVPISFISHADNKNGRKGNSFDM